MSSTTKRYPLSTPDGKPIPLDVVKPVGLVVLPFTAVVSAAIAVPSDNEIISFYATEDCYIQFGGVAAVPASGVYTANMLLVKKSFRLTVAPPSATFTVISAGTNGTLQAQFIDKWASVVLATQTARR